MVRVMVIGVLLMYITDFFLKLGLVLYSPIVLELIAPVKHYVPSSIFIWSFVQLSVWS